MTRKPVRRRKSAGLTRMARIAGYLRSGVFLSLFGVTVLAVALDPPTTWAPEDPWRVVAGIPPVHGPQAATAEMLVSFLDRTRVRLPADVLYDIAGSVAIEGHRHGIDPALLMSVIMVESSFKTDAVSHKGAIGLMQLLPSTAVMVANDLDVPWGGAMRLMDPRTNITLGSYYLRELLEDFDGNLGLALTAYNMGPSQVQSMINRGVIDRDPSSGVSSYSRRVSRRMVQLNTRADSSSL